MSPLLPIAALLLHHPLGVDETLEHLPQPGSLWAAHNWTWEFSIVFPLVVFFVLYVVGAVRRGNIRGLAWRHTAAATGWLSLAFALITPLHRLGDALFSAHMLQHEILVLLAAPLLAAAQCSVTLLYAFPLAWRKTLGGIFSDLQHNGIIALLTAPLAAFLIHAFVLWGWHIPYLYEASVRSDLVHAFQHISFFVSGLIFWAALYGAGRSKMGYGAGVVYVFGTAVHCGALGALLTFSSVIWYPIYESRTHIWSLTPLQDQQLGGLLMWVPSSLVFIAAGIWLFVQWLQHSEHRVVHSSVHDLPAGEEA
ncbi:MAG: cytochrome c oxidase assembly protein [Acidobacteria bacterium]|nr:cytochrome c oxidase assembly protein [Acidobacteriota bacterium]